MDTHLAAVHFRIIMAGTAAEHAVSALMSRRVLIGRQKLAEVLENLKHAHDYLKGAGTFPDLLSYVDGLIAFYNALYQKARIVNVMEAPKMAAAVYANQGNLAAADPYLGIFSEQYRASMAQQAAPLQGTPQTQYTKA